MSKLPLEQRFWSRIAKRETGCWEWTGSRHDRGYGQMYNCEVGGGSRKEFTHRVAWRLTHGDIPAGAHVLHRCDNRLCCNADHLFIGTNDDNIRDKMAKSRQSRGHTHPRTKLSESDIPAIRRDPRNLCQLGRHYGVSAATIRDVKIGKTWRHVP